MQSIIRTIRNTYVFIHGNHRSIEKIIIDRNSTIWLLVCNKEELIWNMAQIRVMFLLLMYVLTVTTFLSDAKSIRNTEIQISSIAELFHLRESLPNVSERRKSKFDIYLHDCWVDSSWNSSKPTVEKILKGRADLIL